MDTNSVIANLEREWDFDTGFFGRLRQGWFDRGSLSRLIRVLEVIDLRDNSTVSRRVVSLLWYMPLFMVWQRERVQEAGADGPELDKATNQVQQLVEQILGIP
jgi:hypothetical protein